MYDCHVLRLGKGDAEALARQRVENALRGYRGAMESEWSYLGRPPGTRFKVRLAQQIIKAIHG